ncbi:SIR2 family protein [Rhodococcus sp. BP-252]|nr:SIR2 family protein [Rhodococcus sp. BP-320]MBY6418615.1 SIR2 family protein [Rhodococcus sp. BP-321]MBY6422910.1 SIR2 family protein [Rhodococcus sp. BP-324]MBY6428741.1 SIR2 family protein [Rhodococcus sp. BP-323]MBY6433736.1 SIR2 family protein [Rhodococcus sp. BP-322]MBY6442680.1 SIR2 family protein [Rhodococcus sp. BP-319]MBY6452335.1 SIR2 family protein [Rhodococcus sp. BP-315]MBY6462312.1 SIR2 family protein [Rhodococcus sp. BP-260]MBY6471776.1 SIR2 family protein [Rhodococcus sp.
MGQFRASGVRDHLTILLGAGASTSSGLPDWDTFASRLLVSSGAVTDSEIATLLMERQDPMLVVEAAKAAAGTRWPQVLRGALYAEVEDEEPSPLHLAAVGHLLDPAAPSTDLVTLNFDTLLEKAIERETSAVVRSSSSGSTVEDADFTVQHLHGVIRREATDQVILTLSEFYDVIADDSAWQASYIRAAVTRGALVIAGTSYRDPDVRHWLHSALPSKPSDREALVLLARQGFKMTKAQFEAAKDALANQWTAIGIKPVLLEDHADAAQIIRELHHVHGANYLAPQERSRTIWNAHSRQFAELQTTYVDLLDADAEIMSRELNVTRLNVTLWLADGTGGLVRWAAHDRVYRSIAALRRIETGHDSQWIAGRALGGEEMLHQDLDGGGTRRWRSVLALPISVPHPELPAVASAVLTLGLPNPTADLAPTATIWGEALQNIANAWSERLGYIGFEGQWQG